MSGIRQELKAEIPLYRNTELETCVPIACPCDKLLGTADSQLIEKIGGPGRTRTCDNTVMSGPKKPGQQRKSQGFRWESLNLAPKDFNWLRLAACPSRAAGCPCRPMPQAPRSRLKSRKRSQRYLHALMSAYFGWGCTRDLTVMERHG